MADVTKNVGNTQKIDKMADITSEEVLVVPETVEVPIKTPGSSSKFKTDAISNWHSDARKIDRDSANFSCDTATEWKYKNLYSISAQNDGQPASWSPCRTAALASEKLPRQTEIIFQTNFLANLCSAMLETKPNGIAKKGKNCLVKLREYLANYQESYGIPRTEYTFPALIKVMGQATGRSLLALLYIVVNITPMAQILLHILRFVLDKTISIQNTNNDVRQMIVKYAVFGLQLLCIYVCLVFIFGFIVMPILYVAIGILVKIMLYD